MAEKATVSVRVDGDSGVQMGFDLQKIMENQKLIIAEYQQVFGTSEPKIFHSPRTEQGDAIIMKAHQAAKAAIKELYPEIQVGLSLSLHDFQPVPGGESAARKEWEAEFTHYLPYIEGDDFLGIQNYTRAYVDGNGILPVEDGMELTQMNYEFYPQGLEHVLRKVAEDFKGDLIVTENGIGTADDARRVTFIDIATDGVVRCIDDGLPVKGYFYWSFMDNFEWQKAYSMTFGLVAVERANGQKRTPKPSLGFLGSLR